MGDSMEAQVGVGFGAVASGEWPAARDAFEAALALGESPEAMFGLAMSYWWLGDMAASVATYERTYTTFQKAADPTLAAASALRLVVHCKQHLANRSAASGWLARAARLIDSAGLEGLRGNLVMLQAYETDDPVAGEQWARRALELAAEAKDADLEIMAMSQVGAALVKQGRVAEGMAFLDEAMAGALAGHGGQLDTVVFTTCTTMVSCSSCADFERAVEWVRATDRFEKRYGCPFLYIECRVVYGTVLVATGQWDKAERELNKAIELSGDAAPTYVVQATAALAELRLAQGCIEEARRLVSGFEGSDEMAVVGARLELVEGRPVVAAAMARRRLDILGERQLASAALLDLLGEAEMAQRDWAAAIERGRTLAGLGQELGCEVIVAYGERLLGSALASSDAQTARAHLEAALASFTRLGLPFEAARSRRALAFLLRSTDPATAEADARVALRMFEDLGAAGDADAVASLLRELGVKGARVGPKRFGTLTKREQDVLGLLAEGLSNPEIAARLVVSRKTVEHHVAAVLSKLGAGSRAEAAVAAVRYGRQGSAAK